MPSKWRSFDDRFWAKVNKTDGCWLWTAATNAQGYGVISAPGRGAGTMLAHRAAWQLTHGELPESGFDHTCRVRRCVNPAHLEPVSQKENIRRSPVMGRPRQTHCKRGHEFTEANTYRWRGSAHCRACSAERQRRYRIKT